MYLTKKFYKKRHFSGLLLIIFYNRVFTRDILRLFSYIQPQPLLKNKIHIKFT